MRTLPLLVLFALAVSCVHAGKLVFFPDSDPSNVQTADLKGFQTDEEVVGLDFRPADQNLYFLTNQNRIYTITATGMLNLVSTLTCTLEGTTFGIDFNPTVDRLRVISNTGANYRIEVTSGNCTVDIDASYAPGDPNQSATPSITAVAYTNNFSGATSTTLFAIDNGIRVLDIVFPPNNGLLTTRGPLGLAASDVISGFDITTSQSGGNVTYLLVNDANGDSKLYSVDLNTGAASDAGAIKASNLIGISHSLISDDLVSYTAASVALAPFAAIFIVLLATVIAA